MLTPAMQHRLPLASAQRGISIVELMVGIAVGLFVVAGATMMAGTQLGDNRRLLAETQLQQDLRAATEIIVREIRRAGAYGTPTTQVWVQDVGAMSNTRSDITLGNEIGSTKQYRSISFDYERMSSLGSQFGPWGFQLDPQAGVIQSRIAGAWQKMTDDKVMKITSFVIRPKESAEELVLPCAKACSPTNPDDTSCWPRLTSRAYTIEISAVSTVDPRVQRTVVAEARPRNDMVKVHSSLPANQVCPL